MSEKSFLLLTILIMALIIWLMVSIGGFLIEGIVDILNDYLYSEFFIGGFIIGFLTSFIYSSPPLFLADESSHFLHHESKWNEKIQKIIEEDDLQIKKELRDKLEEEVNKTKRFTKVRIYVKRISIVAVGVLIFLLNDHLMHVIAVGCLTGWITARIHPKNIGINFYDAFPKRPFFFKRLEKVYDSADDLIKNSKTKWLPKFSVILKWTLDGSTYRVNIRANNKEEAISYALNEFSTKVDRVDIEVFSVSFDKELIQAVNRLSVEMTSKQSLKEMDRNDLGIINSLINWELKTSNKVPGNH